MAATKISVSLSPEDIHYLDTHTLSGRYASRSAALQDAVRALRERELSDGYAEAFAEWDDDDWDDALTDGLTA